MGQSGVIRWITNISIVDHGRLILFTTIFPQEHQDLKSGLVTFHVTRSGLQKVDKVGVDSGLHAHESSWCLGQPHSMYKVGLSECKMDLKVYMVTWTTFKNHPCGDRPNTNTKRPWHSEIPQPLNYSILSCVRTPT